MLRSCMCSDTEALSKGNRVKRFAGIAQWRICFRWTGAGAEDVEIVDYH